MKSILDPSFKYYSASNTDLRRTFRRIRQQRAARAAPLPSPQRKETAQLTVLPVVKRHSFGD
jgi:hypothetical protein